MILCILDYEIDVATRINTALEKYAKISIKLDPGKSVPLVKKKVSVLEKRN